jgi:hypothetical protein
MNHGAGARRSHPAKLARAVMAHLHPDIAALLATTLPTGCSLSAWQPPVMDQGPTGSCTAHSLAGALSTACTKAGKPIGFVPSPREGYACTRAIERAAMTMPGVALPELTDSGAELADALASSANFGVCAIEAPTSDGRYSDVEPANVNAEPSFAQLEAAATSLVTGAYRLDLTAANASDVAAAALVAGFPLYVGFYVDSAFENMGPSDVAGAPNESDPNGGGHATYLCGYRTSASGAREFRLQNSWGDWCDGGSCWVSVAWLRAAWEMWVCDVTVQKGAA